MKLVKNYSVILHFFPAEMTRSHVARISNDWDGDLEGIVWDILDSIWF